MKKMWNWIKKGIGILALATFVISVYAAGEKAEGSAAFSTLESITGKVLGGVTTLEYTAATTNMAAGMITGTFPTGWGVPTTISAYNKVGTYVYMSATSDNNVGPLTVFTHGGGYYWKVTVTALDIAQKAYIYFNNMTTTATAGDQAFTFKQAADSTVTSTAGTQLATLPNIYVWNANNALALMTVLPTPVILSNDVNNLRVQMVLSTSYSGGQIIVSRAVGTPGYMSTPNPCSFSAVEDNNYRSIYAVSTAGVVGTPTITANSAVFPILTAGAGCIVEIRHGDPTGTPTQQPMGSYFAKNLRYNIRANAIFPATTVTPIATTAQYKIEIATPTVVCTVVQDEGIVTIRYNQVKYTNDPKMNKEATSKIMYGSFNINERNLINGMVSKSLGNLDDGVYSCYILTGFYDIYNDGAYRTVTSTTVTTYKLKDTYDYNQLISSEQLKTYSWINQTITVGNPIATTRNAATTVLLDWSAFGDTKSQILLTTNSGYSTVVTKTAGSFEADGYFSQAFPILVTPRVNVQYMLEDGADGVKNIFQNYIELPIR